ncbi:hypothetical protein [Pedobacter cryoconitis]|uniref:Uncharacterized protein n=1 Tax=Pedobacter cryoconitis TaxID=188932 RepID=A0A7X0J7P8_9SPHI|nr:hypothetical protein [Pedobacter cryoconitis]MBB6502611.1 hypothetical protein [Pedobacter cryoconitis]
MEKKIKKEKDIHIAAIKVEKPEKLKTQEPLAEKDEVKQAEENMRERQKHKE